jgi:hypothetical protein
MITNPSACPTVSGPKTPVTLGHCIYCGCADPAEPMVYCYHYPGIVVRLWCVDSQACTARQDAEARFALTELGRQAATR